MRDGIRLSVKGQAGWYVFEHQIVALAFWKLSCTFPFDYLFLYYGSMS